MALEWTSDHAVGVEEIDDQHRELFKKFGALTDACLRGEGRQKLGSLIDFLGEYVVEHFAAEEALMEKHSYPGYLGHRAEHRELAARLEELKGHHEVGGPTIPLLLGTNEVIFSWLVRHIRKSDAEIGDFLKDLPPLSSSASCPQAG